jgi:hypothetical protein
MCVWLHSHPAPYRDAVQMDAAPSQYRQRCRSINKIIRVVVGTSLGARLLAGPAPATVPTGPRPPRSGPRGAGANPDLPGEPIFCHFNLGLKPQVLPIHLRPIHCPRSSGRRAWGRKALLTAWLMAAPGAVGAPGSEALSSREPGSQLLVAGVCTSEPGLGDDRLISLLLRRPRNAELLSPPAPPPAVGLGSLAAAGSTPTAGAEAGTVCAT